MGSGVCGSLGVIVMSLVDLRVNSLDPGLAAYPRMGALTPVELKATGTRKASNAQN